MVLKIEMLGAGAQQKVYTFNKAVVTIGRSPDNDLVIDSNQVSKYHCRLTIRGEQVEIEDLNSTNGIRVNGQPTTRTILLPTDQVSLSFAVSALRVSFQSALELKDLGFDASEESAGVDESSVTMVAQVTLDDAIREQIARNAAERAARKQGALNTPPLSPEPTPQAIPQPIPYRAETPRPKDQKPLWLGLGILTVLFVVLIFVFGR
ncbi:FHA domain-containing protein [Anthocerotibacter panamensis]|uniref:FHA domain-containing protein n=1 Tax=Anthocerotibacter panamensis TaxID=2857077 RepID=UPI001C4065D5|nr:FHA domain-containing protein [Anthocerotibacter panamensis]